MGYRTEKIVSGELFGPVMGIESVMNQLAGNPLYVIILPLGRFCAHASRIESINPGGIETVIIRIFELNR